MDGGQRTVSKLPQIRRLLVEDFLDQKSWISKLFTPINNFMESVQTIFSRGITINDNMAGSVQSVVFNSRPTVAVPMPLKWDLNVKPTAVIVGNVQRKDLADWFCTYTVGVQWKWDVNQGLRLTNISGLAPSVTDQYIITLVIFSG
jgi:hypothetical protein